jgi:phenylpropionate dioxygenase-like ring-hydroxylating dioxygenase large terminal subunit
MYINGLQLFLDNLRTHNFAMPVPNSSFPQGWFAVCTSKELKKNKLKRLSYFNSEFITFRDENGEAVVMDAYCPHMGAYIGRKGKVKDGKVVCPFHHWEFTGKGECAHVPFVDHVPSSDRSKIKTYPTIERNGMVMMWWHSSREPYYDIPDCTNLNGKEWTKPVCFKFLYQGNLTSGKENVCDASHFVNIHDQPEPPEITFTSDGPYAEHYLEVGLNLKIPDFLSERFAKYFGRSKMTTYFWGPSIQNMHAINPTFDMAEIIYSTPIDNRNSVTWMMTSVERKKRFSLMPWLYIAIVKYRVTKDLFLEIPLFNHQKFLEKPLLQKHERNVLKLREWYGQFFEDQVHKGHPIPEDKSDEEDRIRLVEKAG